MSTFKPSIVTVDQLVANANRARTIVINGQPYIARNVNGNVKTCYYSNIFKRIGAAFYVLFGKGMVVRFSEDQYKPSEIMSKVYK